MKRAFDRICHSLSFLPFFPPPSIDNQWNDWGKPRGKGGKKGGIGNGKKKERSRDGMTEARWGLKRHRLFSLDLYHGKMKILFRLYSFTGYIQQGPFKSFDEPSIFIRFGHAFRARAYIHTRTEKKMSDYWEYIRWERVSQEWNVSFVKRGQYCSRIRRTGLLPFLSFLFFSLSLSLLASPTLNNGIWNTGTELCWPSPFCRRYSLETSIKSR